MEMRQTTTLITLLLITLALALTGAVVHLRADEAQTVIINEIAWARRSICQC